MENQKSHYSTQPIYGFRNDASLSGYIQEYLGMEISLFGFLATIPGLIFAF
jgi:hypothetical protein